MDDKLLAECEALRNTYHRWCGLEDGAPGYSELCIERTPPRATDPTALGMIAEAGRRALGVLMGDTDQGRAVWEGCIDNGESVAYNIEVVLADAHYAQLEAERASQCLATLVMGPAHDPYATECDLSVDHAADERADGKTPIHAGPHPLGEGRIRWTGGGSVAGDPLPYKIIEETYPS